MTVWPTLAKGRGGVQQIDSLAGGGAGCGHPAARVRLARARRGRPCRADHHRPGQGGRWGRGGETELPEHLGGAQTPDNQRISLCKNAEA